MIAKGNLHGSGSFLANYLITGDEKETAELVETRGLENLGSDPVQAFETLQKVAEANTRAEKPFFHVQIRNPDGDKRLTDEQWLQIADRVEKRLGFEGQPRIVSFHIDRGTGEKHMHVAWCRVDLDTMRIINPGLYKNHLKQLCRSLEKEYGLREVGSARKPEDIARIADRKEVEEARRLGMDVRAARNAILDCLQRADDGKAFRAALDERGLMLANGDKRDCFVVIDQAGGHHALNKKLTGMTLAQLRDRLSDLDRTHLPSVEQAKAMQQEKHPTPEQAREAQLGSERLRNAPGRYDELRAEPSIPRPAEPQPRPEARHPAYAHEPEKSKDQPAAPQPERWHQRDATKTEEKIFRVQEAAGRGGATVAAGLHAEGLTLARVDAAGIAKVDIELRRQHENAVLRGDAKARLRPVPFREGELVAVNRYGDVHRINPRFIDNEKLERAAMAGTGQTPTLSNALTYFADRSPQNRPPRVDNNPRPAQEPFVGKGRTDAGFKVNVKGATVALSSFVESLFGMGSARAAPEPDMKAPPGPASDPDKAWEEIYEAATQGRALPADAIRHLPPADLENLRRHGDATINNKIMDMERDKGRAGQREMEEGVYDNYLGREMER